MNKKTWVKIKRGLLKPKHRMAMANNIWLYMHILDRANWDTGSVLEWIDQYEADELEMPVETLRYQRKKLEEAEYITSIQKKHHQEIIIHNWTDPRKYDGKVSNQKSKGSKKLSPSNSKGSNKGHNKDANKVSEKVKTPTSNSHNTSHNNTFNTIYNAILKAWELYFPNKPQPRPNTKSYKAKVATRIRDKHFVDNWYSALQKASKNPYLQKVSWFTFGFFIKNELNYRKALHGNYDWLHSKKLEGSERDPEAERRKYVEGKYSEFIDH